MAGGHLTWVQLPAPRPNKNMPEKTEQFDQMGWVESTRQINEVRQFVTRVWEHPLVDETTRRHREQAKQKL